MPTFSFPSERSCFPGRPGKTARAGVGPTKSALPFLPTLLLFLLAAHASAQTADPPPTLVPHDWALTPSGASLGVPFRLVFVTSTTRNATASNIDTYNTFVQTAAMSGHASVRPHRGKFRALASTPGIDARDNTGTNGSTEPMFWLNGVKVADNATDFYDGDWDSLEARNESGNAIPHSNESAIRFWTGSDSDGTRAISSIGYFTVGSPDRDNPLQLARRGRIPPQSPGRSPLSDSAGPRLDIYGFLAVSSPFRAVPTASITTGVSGGTSEIMEGGAIVFGVSVTGQDSNASRNVRVRVTDDPDGNFLDASDEGVRTVSVTGSATTRVSIPTLVDAGSRDGTVTLEIAEAQELPGQRYYAASNTAIAVSDDPVSSGRTLVVTAGSAVEGTRLPLTLTLSEMVATGDSVPSVVVSTVAEGGDCAATAVPGDNGDYSALEGVTISFGAGAMGITQLLDTQDDDHYEGDEFICIRIGEPRNLVLPSKAVYVKAVVRDNDPPPVVSVSSPRAAENSAALTFEVELDRQNQSEEVTVAYADAGRGTARSGSDYTALAAGALTFNKGGTSKTVTVQIKEDQESEENETVVLRFNKVENAALDGGGRNLFATGTIVDNDRVRHSLRIREPSRFGVAVLEGETVRVHVDFWVDGEKVGPYDEDVTFTWGTTSLTATAGSDYTAVSNASATIPAGETSVALEVETFADTSDGPIEEFYIGLNDVAATLRNDVQVLKKVTNVKIYDGPTLRISDAPRRTEGQPLEFPVTLGFAAPSDVEVRWKTESRTGQKATADVDYTAVASGALTIPVGETRGVIRIQTLQDSLDEPDEDFTVTLVAPYPAGVDQDLNRLRATGVIRDDDARPTVTMADVSANEGDTLTFKVALDRGSGKPVQLGWATRSPDRAGATFGEDYRGKQSGDLTIAPGSVRATIEFATVDDDLDEPDETFEVLLFEREAAPDLPVDSARAGFSAQQQSIVPVLDATATIVDNDATTLAIRDAPPNTEGSTDRPYFIVTLSSAQATPVTVTVASADGDNADKPGQRTTNATGGSGLEAGDYIRLPARTLTFSPGETTKRLEINVIDDEDVENTENFRMVLSSPVGAAISRGTAFGTIVDDDGVRYSIANEVREVREGGSVRVRVRRDRTDTVSPDIRFCLEPTGTGSGHAVVTRTVGADSDVYLRNPTSDSTLCTAIGDAYDPPVRRFAVGQHEVSFDVHTVIDDRFEGDETFLVRSRNEFTNEATDVHLFPKAFTVLDADVGRLRIVGKNSLYEGQRADFEIYVDDPAALKTDSTDVYVTTSDGTATAGEDYRGHSRTLVSLIKPASASRRIATFSVDTLDDDDFEDDETFSVTLVGLPDHLLLDSMSGSVTVTVRDEDGNKVYLDDTVVDEGDSAALDVRLESPVNEAVEVTWKTVAGSAVSPGDFTAVTDGTVEIPAGGAAAAVRVATIDDTTKEETESFRVVITDVDYADAVIGRSGIVTIRDDDTGLTVSGLSDATVEENAAWTSSVPSVGGLTAGDVLWTVEGDDAALFAIDSDTGRLALAAQNFEQPADMDKDNEYEVTVRVTDEDGATGSQAVAVTVTDVVYGEVRLLFDSERIDVGEAPDTLIQTIAFYKTYGSRSARADRPKDVDLAWELSFLPEGDNAADANDATLPSTGGSRKLQWLTPNTLTVVDIVDDSIAEYAEEFDIEFSVNNDDVLILSSFADRSTNKYVNSVRVRILANDPPYPVISTDGFGISETDDPLSENFEEHKHSFTIKLDRQPLADATVNLSVRANAAITLDKTSAVFTPENWNEEQIVTVCNRWTCDSCWA